MRLTEKVKNMRYVRTEEGITYFPFPHELDSFSLFSRRVREGLVVHGGVFAHLAEGAVVNQPPNLVLVQLLLQELGHLPHYPGQILSSK